MSRETVMTDNGWIEQESIAIGDADDEPTTFIRLWKAGEPDHKLWYVVWRYVSIDEQGMRQIAHDAWYGTNEEQARSTYQHHARNLTVSQAVMALNRG